MIGKTLSHYKILAKIGQGGMGEVFLAEDLNLKRRVAIKILPDQVARNETRLHRFQREAEAVAAINHPGIVTIYSIEKHREDRFITMEMVDGESLDQHIPDGGLGLAQTFEIAIPLTDALAAAHARGVIHRDLKPQNVMISTEGRVKVLDFGLAKLALDDADSAELSAEEMKTRVATLTRQGAVLGTAPYMSPEQLEGKSIDHRSDVFSLGVVLYEMATGALPFAGTSAAQVASSILRDPPRSVTELNATLPRHLGRIIHHCLEKDPERRYQSALDVRNELEGLRREIDSGEFHTSQADSMPMRQSAPEAQVPDRVDVHPRPSRWALAALAIALVGALAIWWVGQSEDQVSMEGVPQPRSVAVLPFVDLSPEKDQEHFTDGMTEEIIHALARIDGLDVPSRSATFALKGRQIDLAEVAAALAVDTVVEGSVRKAGENLRISAQLVQASNGFELWSQTYDRRLEDVFALQDEIAGNIASALELTLAPTDVGIAQAETANFEAYDYYLRGLEYYEKQTKEDFEYSCEMFQRAAEVDPSYALAYNGLARCHGALYDVYGEVEEHLDAVDQASLTALELAPNLADSHMARGNYFALTGAVEDAVREYELSIELDPELARAYFAYGNFLFKHGRLEETAELWEKASQIDPDDLRPIRLLPQVYRSLGWQEQLDRATLRRIDAAERRLALNPDDQAMRLAGAISLLGVGQEERAFEWAAQVVENSAGDALLLYNSACFYSRAGRTDDAISALERAYEAGDRESDWWRQDSDLDPIREDPRFVALLAKMDRGQG